MANDSGRGSCFSTLALLVHCARAGARTSGSTHAAICVSTNTGSRQRSGRKPREVINRGRDIDLRDRRVCSNRWNLPPADAVIAKNAFRYAGERMQRFFIAAPVPHGIGNGLDDGPARATDASSPCRATGRPRKYSQIDSPQPRMRADNVYSAIEPHPPFGGTEKKMLPL